ncbi:MAG: hypothetical protein HY873_14350 [Chloroflexi bacterium]|nr:hypothetical protein [Chloroflexota bacterium]
MNAEVAIIAGLIGGAAMVAMLYAAMWLLPDQIRMNLLLLVGTMFAPASGAAYGIGFMIHMMMSGAFGLAHGALIESAGVTSAGAGAGYGAVFGLGHALAAGMALGMMPALHPRMRKSEHALTPAFAGGPGPSNGELLEPPGFFGLNYPRMTTAGFFALHVMFGVIVGVGYGAWA